jgi:tetratricopeptide (TPR) repeat protein
MNKALTSIFVGMLSIGALAQTNVCVDAAATFRERKWAEAAEAFAQCEQQEPGKTDALLFRGKALVNLNRYDEAAGALKNYAKRNPQSDDAAYLLAYISFRQDRPNESLQLFSHAANLKPPTANDLTIIALDYVLLNDFNDAASYLEQALRKDPDDVEARYHLGRVRYQQNQFDLAVAAFKEVLQRDPRNEKAEDNLGLSLEAKNEVGPAVSAYKRAIELDSAGSTHSEQPYLNLGSLLAKSNRTDEAIPLLIRACEIAPAAFNVHYELGKAYFASNQYELARAQAERAATISPSDSTVHYLLGRIYQHLGQREQAKEQFQRTSDLLHEKNAKGEAEKSSEAGSPLGSSPQR